MNRFPLVISFYTLDTPYEQEVEHLIRSCEKFSIEHQIEGIPSHGSWEKNCVFKPLFILKKLEELKRPLLWVDADAVFVRPLVSSDLFSLDLGVRLYDCPDDHPSRVVSSTVFVNATDGGRKVVGLWAQKCLSLLRQKGRKKEVWDQDALRGVLFEQEHGVSWGALPDFYSVIEGHPEDEKNCTFPMIVQNQASRRYKRWINHPEDRFFTTS